MDDSYLSGLINVFIIVVVAIRFLNNLFQAGYLGLGQISLFSLAEKAKEAKFNLGKYLDEPLRLNLSVQIVDKTGLLLLVFLILKATPEPTLFLWGGLLVYLLLFDHVIPALAAAFAAEKLVTALFPILRTAYAPVTPVALLVEKFAQRGKRDEAQMEEDPEDVKAFLRAGTEEGIIEEKEQLLLHNLINFNDVVVREVMTPRTDMICVDRAMTNEEILGVFRTTKYSRLPVYRKNIDHVEGVLRFKDLIELMDKPGDIGDFITDVLFVPELKSISDLLQELLKKRLQMAIVIDEFGGTSGLITMEDVIEEIIGEIHDEHEAPEADQIIKMQDGSYLVDGKVLLEDFCKLLSIDLEVDDIDTVGGYIFNKEGRIPREGDHVSIGEVEVEISKSDERRIYKVLALPSNPKTETPAQSL